MYDIIIIGAGIAGLHCAYRLQNHYDNILVLEENSCIGGRIKTVQIHGSIIEAGAGRLNQTHRLYSSLLKELHLETKPIDGIIQHYDTDSLFHLQNPFTTLDKVLKVAKKESTQKLQQLSFLQYAKTILTKNEIEFVVGAFGYYQQLAEMNAFNAIKLFDKGMHSKNKFEIVNGGMSQVIYKLYNKIKKKCTVYCKQTVSAVTYNESMSHFEVFVEGKFKPFIAKYCIAAIPKYSLQKLDYCKPFRSLLNTIEVKILCRIYAFFHKKDIWFYDLLKTTVNNEVRYIIPIDRENGVIMISYTDSHFAQFWAKLPEKEVIPTLKLKLGEALHRDIPTPKDVRAFYWNTGTAFWKPTVDSKKIARSILQPIPTEPFFICGENYSQTQGWIEGALETSTEVIESICKV